MTYTPKRDCAIFEKDGDLLIPTILAKGPWYANSLHGSSMMGIMARAADQHPSDIPRLVSRLTVDMMRAAPMGPLKTETEIVRSGKNVEFLDIRLLSEGELYVRGSAMRIRQKNVGIEDYFSGIPPYPSLPESNGHAFFQWPGAEDPGYHHSIDIRMDEHEGKPVLWFRLAVPLTEGEENSSIVQLATACDWTYAVPNIVYRHKNNLGMEEQKFFAINPDTTINFFRPIAGKWVGIKAQATYGEIGSGCCGAQLFDEKGPVGFSSQTVLIRGNEGAPMHVKKSRK
jgi:acyl-coenzyme A thioesterase PaaI-like protein